MFPSRQAQNSLHTVEVFPSPHLFLTWLQTLRRQFQPRIASKKAEDGCIVQDSPRERPHTPIVRWLVSGNRAVKTVLLLKWITIMDSNSAKDSGTLYS